MAFTKLACAKAIAVSLLLIAGGLAIAGVLLPWWSTEVEGPAGVVKYEITLWQQKMEMTPHGAQTGENEFTICTNGIDQSSEMCHKIRTIRAFAILTAVFGILSAMCMVRVKTTKIGSCIAMASVIFAAIAIIVAAVTDISTVELMNESSLGFILHLAASGSAFFGAITALCVARAVRKSAQKEKKDAGADVSGQDEEPSSPMKKNAAVFQELEADCSLMQADIEQTAEMDGSRAPIWSLTPALGASPALGA